MGGLFRSRLVAILDAVLVKLEFVMCCGAIAERFRIDYIAQLQRLQGGVRSHWLLSSASA